MEGKLKKLWLRKKSTKETRNAEERGTNFGPVELVSQCCGASSFTGFLMDLREGNWSEGGRHEMANAQSVQVRKVERLEER